ncbi:MAG: endosialidase [Lachnospiraceae bacterium]|nr:endosialidase [Lachnospiraceae bacterium]
MAAVNELIRIESNDTISFGDYTLDAKAKLDNFEFAGDIYKVKTFREITKLERNGLFVYESVPGTAVMNFVESEDEVDFVVEGPEDAQITLGLAEESEYEITIDGTSAGTMKTNLGGKFSFSVELEDADSVAVKVVKKQ